MTDKAPFNIARIVDETTLTAALAALRADHPSVVQLIEEGHPIPLRKRPEGLGTLCEIITSQVISRRAADVLWRRLTATLDPNDAHAVTEAPDSAFLDAGLTRSKMSAMRHAAMAIQNGSLVLDNPTDGSRQGLGGRTALDALKHLTAIKGIGPWTAEVYLLFAVGHLDVFPAGDVALQSMVQSHFERPERPKAVEVRRLVEPFQPLRGVLARVFYAAYGARQTATPTWRGAPV